MRIKFLIFILPVFLCSASCKTILGTVSLTGAAGAVSMAGWGGAIDYKDRKGTAFKAGLAGLIAGAAAGYYLHNRIEKDKTASYKDGFGASNKSHRKAINDALNMCKEKTKPQLVPQFIPGKVIGDKYLSPRIDWYIKGSESILRNNGIPKKDGEN